MGGMGMARPVLNAMKVDDMRDFGYKAELYDELYTSTSIYNRHNRGLRRKSSYIPAYNSDGETDRMTNRRFRIRKGLKRAASFSSHITKSVV